MVSRRLLLGATIVSLLVAMLGVAIYVQQRIDSCAYVPLLADQLLPNAELTTSDTSAGMPDGWGRNAGGVELRGPAVDGEGFDVDGDGRALQLIGIANYARTPPMAIQADTAYCFSGLALTDSTARSTTRARLVFHWYDSAGDLIETATTLWQPVRLWTPENPPRDWSPLRGGAPAPPNAAGLTVQIEPASDDRIYLDAMTVRRGGADVEPALKADARVLPRVLDWPYARRAAISFSFDWETTMGGLIHSRSVGDPNFDADPLLRGMRMRAGITTTMELFAPYDVRATYFATGYNFLRGNREQRRFMGDPIFSWAITENGWLSDRWATTPWFADDPYGTIASDPAWYFGDLIDPLQSVGHEIQSHTFSHLYGGRADPETWRADLSTWNAEADRAGVAPATALAFPWSGSDGMSDANWDMLEQAGITAVTRLSDYGPYNLFPTDDRGVVRDPQCRWLPGRADRILACPDFYLTVERIPLALAQIGAAVEAGGMIDLWAHTEEVVTPEQIAAWTRVVARVADDDRIWVAPFGEIAAWKLATAQVQIERLKIRATMARSAF